jgi:hypothetical protein
MNFPNQSQPSSNQNIQFPDNITDVGASIQNTYNDVTQSIKSSMNEFSQSTEINVGASQMFLDSNTIIAKFAFLILIIIVFLFILNLGISLLSRWFAPSANPYLIKGMISGNQSTTITQDPNDSNSILVKRSNNQSTGLEFTWSSWINIQELENDSSFHHIFNKGNNTFYNDGNLLHDGIATINNCPGLYLKKSNNSTATLRVIVNTSGTSPGSVGEEHVDITDIPIKKWVNVIIRCQNTMIDVYINGTITERLNLNGAPIQNFNNVNVCHNKGFNGKLSNLLYYSSAIDIFKINQIISAGPSLTAADADDTKLLPNYNFLSNMWYSNKM